MTQVDPAAAPARPQSWNRYAYVLNRPLALTDPLGLMCEPDNPQCSQRDPTKTGGGGGLFGNWDEFGLMNMPVVTTELGDETFDVPPNVTAVTFPDGAISASIIYQQIEVFTQTIYNVGSGFDFLPPPVGPGVSGGGGGPSIQLQTNAPARRTKAKEPCPPLAHDPNAHGLDALFDGFSRVMHPLDMIAINSTFFISGAAAMGAGGAAIIGGCAEPTPAEPLTCVAGVAGGLPTMEGGAFLIGQGFSFFKNSTLPAIKNWGCEE